GKVTAGRQTIPRSQNPLFDLLPDGFDKLAVDRFLGAFIKYDADIGRVHNLITSTQFYTRMLRDDRFRNQTLIHPIISPIPPAINVVRTAPDSGIALCNAAAPNRSVAYQM